MGWGTAFNTEIYLNRKIFNHKYEVEDEIQQNEKYILDSITKLKMFVSANPRDIVDIEWKGKVIHCQHYPFDKSVLASDEIYVHGHTHSKIPFENNQNNVSWEAWYRPVNIEELSPVSKEN